jgi:four helix bundle protein
VGLVEYIRFIEFIEFVGFIELQRRRWRRSSGLKSWKYGKQVRDVVNAVYKASSDGAFARDYALRDQVRRAAISIPSNIAEGFSRHSNKEFIQFLFISKGSAAEVQSQLYTALDQDYISRDAFDKMYQEIEVVAKQLSRLITYLKRSS